MNFFKNIVEKPLLSLYFYLLTIPISFIAFFDQSYYVFYYYFNRAYYPLTLLYIVEIMVSINRQFMKKEKLF